MVCTRRFIVATFLTISQVTTLQKQQKIEHAVTTGELEAIFVCYQENEVYSKSKVTNRFKYFARGKRLMQPVYHSLFFGKSLVHTSISKLI
jgi:hypothetical protein